MTFPRLLSPSTAFSRFSKVIVGMHASADSVSNDRAYLAQAEFPPMHLSFSKSKEAAEADAKKAAEEQEVPHVGH